ncbi:hypothetical protein ACOMHN_013706 [Nucella lapillus]
MQNDEYAGIEYQSAMQIAGYAGIEYQSAMQIDEYAGIKYQSAMQIDEYAGIKYQSGILTACQEYWVAIACPIQQETSRTLQSIGNFSASVGSSKPDARSSHSPPSSQTCCGESL